MSTSDLSVQTHTHMQPYTLMCIQIDIHTQKFLRLPSLYIRIVIRSFGINSHRHYLYIIKSCWREKGKRLDIDKYLVILAIIVYYSLF